MASCTTLMSSIKRPADCPRARSHGRLQRAGCAPSGQHHHHQREASRASLARGLRTGSVGSATRGLARHRRPTARSPSCEVQLRKSSTLVLAQDSHAKAAAVAAAAAREEHAQHCASKFVYSLIDGAVEDFTDDVVHDVDDEVVEQSAAAGAALLVQSASEPPIDECYEDEAFFEEDDVTWAAATAITEEAAEDAVRAASPMSSSCSMNVNVSGSNVDVSSSFQVDCEDDDYEEVLSLSSETPSTEDLDEELEAKQYLEMALHLARAAVEDGCHKHAHAVVEEEHVPEEQEVIFQSGGARPRDEFVFHCVSNVLDGAISQMAAKAEEDHTHIEEDEVRVKDLRGKARDLLMQATNDGTIERALCRMLQVQSPHSRCMGARLKARGLLWQASREGRLHQTLVDNTDGRGRRAQEESKAEEGEAEEEKAEVDEEKEEDAVQSYEAKYVQDEEHEEYDHETRVRVQVKDLLAQACTDGRFLAALQRVKATPLSKEQATQADAPAGVGGDRSSIATLARTTSQPKVRTSGTSESRTRRRIIGAVVRGPATPEPPTPPFDKEAEVERLWSPTTSMRAWPGSPSSRPRTSEPLTPSARSRRLKRALNLNEALHHSGAPVFLRSDSMPSIGARGPSAMALDLDGAKSKSPSTMQPSRRRHLATPMDQLMSRSSSLGAIRVTKGTEAKSFGLLPPLSVAVCKRHSQSSGLLPSLQGKLSSSDAVTWSVHMAKKTPKWSDVGSVF